MDTKYSQNGTIIPKYNREEYLQNIFNKPSDKAENKNNASAKVGSNQNFLLRTGATVNDVTQNFATGVGNFFEGVFDLGTSLVSGTFKLFGNDEISDKINNFIKQDYITDAFKTMGKQTDMVNLVWSIKDSIEGKQDAWTTDLIEKITGEKTENMSYINELPQDITDNVRGGIQSVGQMIPSIATGQVAGEVGSLATLGLSATGNATKEGLQETNDIGKSLGYGIGSGAVEVASEIVVGKALGKLGLGTGKVLGVVGKDGIGKTVGKNTATRVITDLLKTFNEEGVEEVFSDVLNPVLKEFTLHSEDTKKNGVINQYVNDFNNNGGFKGLLDSYLVGGTIGALFGGSEIALGSKQYQGAKNYYAYKDAQAILETRNEIAKEIENLKGNETTNSKIEQLQDKLAMQESKFQDNFKKYLEEVSKNPKILEENQNYATDLLNAINDELYTNKQVVQNTLGNNVNFVEGNESSYNGNNSFNVGIDKIKTVNGLKSVIMHEYGHNLNSKTSSNKYRNAVNNNYVENDLGITKDSDTYKKYEKAYNKESKEYAEKFLGLKEGTKEYNNAVNSYINEEIAMDSISQSGMSLNQYKRIIGSEGKSKVKKFINRFIDIIEKHTKSKNYNSTKEFLKNIAKESNIEESYVEQRLADVRNQKTVEYSDKEFDDDLLDLEDLEDLIKELEKEESSYMPSGKYKTNFLTGEKLSREEIIKMQKEALKEHNEKVNAYKNLDDNQKKENALTKAYERDYMKFVYSLNKKLSNNQKEFFKNSKVASDFSKGVSPLSYISTMWDYNKKQKGLDFKKEHFLIPMFHATPNSDMYYFDSKRIGKTNGRVRGDGFYLSSEIGSVTQYKGDSGKVIASFVNIEKPLSVTSKEITKNELLKFLNVLGKEACEDIIGGANAYNSNLSYNKMLENAVDFYIKNANSDWYMIQDLYSLSRMDFDSFFNKLTDTLGYDGAIFWGNAEYGTLAIALHSNQIKDITNLNPTKSPDIRYQKLSKDTTLNDVLQKGLDQVSKYNKEYEEQAHKILDKANPSTKITKSEFDILKKYSKLSFAKDTLDGNTYKESSDIIVYNDKIYGIKKESSNSYILRSQTLEKTKEILSKNNNGNRKVITPHSDFVQSQKKVDSVQKKNYEEEKKSQMSSVKDKDTKQQKDLHYEKNNNVDKAIDINNSSVNNSVKGRKIPTTVSMAQDIKSNVQKSITNKLDRVFENTKFDIEVNLGKDETFNDTLGKQIKTINNKEEVGKVIAEYMYKNLSVDLSIDNGGKTTLKISDLYSQKELYKDIMNSNVRVFTFDHIVNLFKRKATSYCNALIYEKTFNRIQNSMRNTASKFQNKINKSGKGTSKELSEAVKQLGSLFGKKLDRTHFSNSAREIAEGMAKVYDMDIKQSGKEEFGYYEDDTQRITPFGLPYNEEISSLLHEIGSGTDKLSLDELNFLYGFQKQVINSLLNTVNDVAMVHNVEHSLEKDSKNFGKKISELKVYNPNAITKAVKTYTNEVLDPKAVLSSLDGYKENGYFSTVYNLMKESQNIEYKNKMSMEDKIRDLLITKIGTETKYKKSLSKEKVDLGFKDSNGENVSVTKGQLISMYLTSMVESGDGHFYNARGGIDIAEEDGRIRHISHKELPVDENGNHTLTQFLETKLSEEDKTFTKAIIDVMEEAKGYLEEEQRQLLGASNMSDGFYFPTKGSPRSQSVNLSNEVSSFGDIDYVSKQSFVKSKVANTGALLILNADSIVQNYINGVARYTAYATSLDYVQRLLNTNFIDENGKNQTLSRLLKDKNVSLKYLQEYLKDIQGVRDSSYNSFVNKLFRGLRNASTTAVLGANLQVCVTQTASYWGAISYGVKIRNLIKAQGKALTSNVMKTAKSYLMENSPYIKMRFRDNEVIKGNVLSESINVVNKALMKGISFMDEQTILAKFVACQYEVESRHKGDDNYKFGTDLNKQEALKLHEEVVRGTDPNYNAVEKSALQRNKNEIVKGFARFTNQPTKTLSRIVEGFGKWQTLSKEYRMAQNNGLATDSMKNSVIQARKQFSNAMTSFLAQSTVFILMVEFFKRLKGKKEWEEGITAQEFASDFFSNSFMGMFPFFKDISGYLLNGYDLQAPSYANLNNILSAVKTMTSAIQEGLDGKDVEWSKPIRQTTFAISEVLGLPTENLYKYTYGIVKSFNPETAYKMRNVMYHSSTNYTKDFKNALDKGNTSLAKTILNENLKDRFTTSPNQRVVNEMITLYRKGYEDVIPSKVSEKMYIDGVEYELKKNQLDSFKLNYSKANEKALTLINSSSYGKLTEESKNNAISRLYKAYYEYSKSQLKKDYISSNKLSYFVNKNGININNLCTALAYIKYMKVDTKKNQTKKDLVQKYINSLAVSKKEKYLLWVLAGYKLTDSQKKEMKTYLKTVGLTEKQIDNILKDKED